jgi:predicted alpha/beta superfamily hydrolase
MHRRPLIAALLALTLALPPAAAARARFAFPGGEVLAGPGVTGRVLVHRGVRSSHLEHARDVWVWLPPGYDASRRERYPVLYAHDGNNLFDPRSAFLGREWRLDEVADELIRAGQLPRIVIVGVGNSPARLDEYTWVRGTAQGQTAGGRGAAYARFLVEELKPAIDRRYRTKTTPADTAVMGSSLGGLISLYLGIHHRGTFGRLGIVSPSVWWADRAALQHAEALPMGLRVWLDIGMHEGDAGTPPPAVANARALLTVLENLGYDQGAELAYFEDANGHHDEPSWSKRAPRILRFLFDDR